VKQHLPLGKLGNALAAVFNATDRVRRSGRHHPASASCPRSGRPEGAVGARAGPFVSVGPLLLSLGLGLMFATRAWKQSWVAVTIYCLLMIPALLAIAAWLSVAVLGNLE
jgi:hypothetical protein